MIGSYIKIAWRNIISNKVFASLNVLGLMLGMTVFLLINLYVRNERSYDSFHHDGDRIYRVAYTHNSQGGEELFRSATTYPRVGKELPREMNAVESAVRLYMVYGGAVVRNGERSMREDRIFVADPAFLEMFSYPWLAGNPETALDGPNKVVISADFARRMFPSGEPVGQRLKVGNNFDLEITGIMESVPNSHLRFDLLVSYPTGTQIFGENFDTSWGWYDFYTYVKLREGASPEEVENQFPAFITKFANSETANETTIFHLQPLEDIYLTSDLIQEAEVNGSASITNFLFILSFAILGIAWINYTNLATARAMNRAREVGIRKSVGALPGQLIIQFLLEALMLNLIAAAFSLLLTDFLLPWFQQLTGSGLSLSLFITGSFWVYALSALLAGSIISGFYPAFILTRYKPSQVLKGHWKGSAGGQNLRKGLVISQFVASILLITGTLVVYQQLHFMRNQELGIDIRQKMVIQGPQVVNDSLYMTGYQSFRNELLAKAGVESMTAVSEIPGNLIYWTNGLRRYDNEEVNTQLYLVALDEYFQEVFDNKLLAGRFFSSDYNEDEHIIFNKKACIDLGYRNPEEIIGEPVLVGGDTLRVIGVIENYHQQGLENDVTPVAFRYLPEVREYYVLDVSGDVSQLRTEIESDFNRYFDGNPYSAFLLDNYYNEQYASEEKFGQVVFLFSGVAILIASLGLIGLSLFSAYQRTREIGIRKVLGASPLSILSELSREYLVMVVVALLIAGPLSWWLITRWLENFAYHIEMDLGKLLAGGLITIVFAMLAIIWQGWSASTQNPVKALRTE